MIEIEKSLISITITLKKENQGKNNLALLKLIENYYFMITET